jgi:hypothetical protein
MYQRDSLAVTARVGQTRFFLNSDQPPAKSLPAVDASPALKSLLALGGNFAVKKAAKL